MKIIDDFLDKEDLEDLKCIVLGDKFPWYLNDGVSVPDDGHLQFTHQIYKDNQFTSSYTLGGLDIFKEKLGFEKILRAKFNLLHQSDQIIEHAFHTDLENPSSDVTTAILYLNTNNGYTMFENGDKVESIENRLITFNNNLKHNGTTSTNSQTRIVLNLCYEKN